MSLRSRIATAALLTLLSATSCWAEPVGVVTALDGFYRADLGARQAVELGFAGNYGGQIIAVEGLAYAPNGDLYGITDNLKSLFRFNPANGAATFVGPLGLSGEGQFNNLDTAFAITADGHAWLASAVVGKLWTVNLGTGAASPVGDLGYKISGLAARGNELFAAGSRGDEGLYRVNTTSGKATLIAGFKRVIPYAPTISLGFDEQDQLWAVINYNPPQNDNGSLATWSDVARVNPDNGDITLTGSLTGPSSLQTISVRGLSITPPRLVAAAPVPVPANSSSPLAALLLALGLAGVIGLRRRAY